MRKTFNPVLKHLQKCNLLDAKSYGNPLGCVLVISKAEILQLFLSPLRVKEDSYFLTFLVVRGQSVKLIKSDLHLI